MRLKTLRNAKLVRNTRVLMRCDLNMKIASGKIESSDVWKLQAIIPTIQLLLRRNCSIILVSHRGRPRGYDHNESLKPIVAKLAKLIGHPIDFWDQDVHSLAKKAKHLSAGQIVCLENIRFNPKEDKNDPHFAKQLASLADVYVNDAFANIHRNHASMVGVTRFLPSYAGLLLEYELKNLYCLLDHAKHPVVAIIGGSKISSKIRLLKRLMRRVDYMLMGGALANNVIAAMGYTVGKSVYEKDMVSWSKSLLTNKLKLPLDVRVARSLKAQSRICAVAKVRDSEMILDLGPDTMKLYRSVIRKARTVIWNGPLGYFEDARYAKSTNDMMKSLASARARAYIGGGETVKAVLQQHVEKKVYFVSTGGGAMLALLEGKPLPGLRPLIKH